MVVCAAELSTIASEFRRIGMELYLLYPIYYSLQVI